MGHESERRGMDPGNPHNSPFLTPTVTKLLMMAYLRGKLRNEDPVI